MKMPLREGVAHAFSARGICGLDCPKYTPRPVQKTICFPTLFSIFVDAASEETVAVLKKSVYDWSDNAAISLSEKRRICLRPVNDTTPQDTANIAIAAIAAMLLSEWFFMTPDVLVFANITKVHVFGYFCVSKAIHYEKDLTSSRSSCCDHSGSQCPESQGNAQIRHQGN